MINKDSLIEIIVKPSLLALNMYCESSVNLMLGTYAVESDFCTYPTQINGPAISWLCIEKATYDDIYLNYLKTRWSIRNRILEFCRLEAIPAYEYLLVNAHYSCMIARIKYYRDKEPLPGATDVQGLANYWKRVYNTEAGKGTVDNFIKKYEKYVSRGKI